MPQEIITVYPIHFKVYFCHPPPSFHPGTIVAHTVSEGHIAVFRFGRRGTEGAESHYKDLTYRGRLNLMPNTLSATTHVNKACVTASLLETFPLSVFFTPEENPAHLCVL